MMSLSFLGEVRRQSGVRDSLSVPSSIFNALPHLAGPMDCIGCGARLLRPTDPAPSDCSFS
jgi:hypothetical protein